MKKNSWGIFSAVLVVDLLSKSLVLHEVVFFEVTKNPGLPFIGKVLPGFFDFILVLLAFGVFVFLYKKYFSEESETGFALIVGGALANILDRAVTGGVTDFIDVGLGGSFNLADVAIWVGIVFLIISTLKKPLVHNS